MTARAALSEPQCCGQPMVHNSATGEWECADAYFSLLDEGIIDETTPIESLDPNDDLGPGVSPILMHWRASRTPDGRETP